MNKLKNKITLEMIPPRDEVFYVTLPHEWKVLYYRDQFGFLNYEVTKNSITQEVLDILNIQCRPDQLNERPVHSVVFKIPIKKWVSRYYYPIVVVPEAPHDTFAAYILDTAHSVCSIVFGRTIIEGNIPFLFARIITGSDELKLSHLLKSSLPAVHLEEIPSDELRQFIPKAISFIELNTILTYYS